MSDVPTYVVLAIGILIGIFLDYLSKVVVGMAGGRGRFAPSRHKVPRRIQLQRILDETLSQNEDKAKL